MKNISELNKLRVRLFIEAVLNEGRLELIDELIAADFVGHLPGAEPDVTGPVGVRHFVSSRRGVRNTIAFVASAPRSCSLQGAGAVCAGHVV